MPYSFVTFRARQLSTLMHLIGFALGRYILLQNCNFELDGLVMQG